MLWDVWCTAGTAATTEKSGARTIGVHRSIAERWIRGSKGKIDDGLTRYVSELGQGDGEHRSERRRGGMGRERDVVGAKADRSGRP